MKKYIRLSRYFLATLCVTSLALWAAEIASPYFAAGCVAAALPALGELFLHFQRRKILYSVRSGDLDLTVVELRPPPFSMRPRIRQIEIPGGFYYSRISLSPGAPVIAMTFFPEIIDSGLHRNHPSRLLLLGVAGGGIIRYYLEHYKLCEPVGVELCPELLGIARQYFLFDQDLSRCRLECAEATAFMRDLSPEEKFDAICVDIFAGGVPADSAFDPGMWRNAYEHLSEGGIVVANLLNADPNKLQQLIDFLRTLGWVGIFISGRKTPVLAFSASGERLQKISDRPRLRKTLIFPHLSVENE